MASMLPWQMSTECGTGTNQEVMPHVRPGSGQASNAVDRETTLQIEQRLTHLARTIENEIIPRLMLAHADARLPLAPMDWPAPPAAIRQTDVDQFTALVLSAENNFVLKFVEELLEKGVALEQMFLNLLAPTARRLGEMWTEDLCTFTDVTVGLSQLQQVLRELSPAFEQEQEGDDLPYRILLVPLFGERHTFGLFMVEEFFRRAGWDVWGACTLDASAVRRIVSKQWIDVVGFSASGEVLVEKLGAEIRNVRKQSVNKRLTVMVGGSLFVARPELVAEVGADCTAVDGKEAVMHALAAVAGNSVRR